MSRRVAREKALQALFQIDLVGADTEAALTYVLEVSSLEEKDREFAASLVRGVLAHQQECDQYIARYARQWELDRLANVDKNILRLALFEMKYLLEIPHSVSINEAIELAKAFSSDASARFINGLLDSALKQEIAVNTEG